MCVWLTVNPRCLGPRFRIWEQTVLGISAAATRVRPVSQWSTCEVKEIAVRLAIRAFLTLFPRLELLMRSWSPVDSREQAGMCRIEYLHRKCLEACRDAIEMNMELIAARSIRGGSEKS